MRLTDIDKLQLKLREYADKKAFNGEIEVANGILKAKCFIDQECTVIEEKQLNNGWIPVSERLPMQEDGRGVWVLTCATSGLIESSHFCNGRFYDADKNGYKIVAWQPLPEPYKEESNDL